MKRFLLCTTALLYSSQSFAANFTVSNGQTVGYQSINGVETGVIEAGGTVSEAGVGVETTGNGGHITNNGTITTTGFGGRPVNINGSNTTFINNGAIIATGNNSHIQTTGSNTSIINNGTVSVSGDTTYVFYVASGNNSSVVNNGTMTITGNDSVAMQSTTDSTLLVNYGTINTTGSNGYGMAADSGPGTNNTLINYGIIHTTGINGDGMVNALSGGGTLTNYGNIQVAGASSDAMLIDENITLTNYGRAVALGTGNGIRATGNGNTITNSGYVASEGGNSIEMQGNNNTLILKPNSVVDGTVIFGGTNGALIYDVSGTGRAGSVINIASTVTNAATTSILNASSIPQGAHIVQGGNTVAVVTPDQFSASQQIVNNVVSDAGNILSNRQQLALLGETTEAADGTQYAASSSTMNDAVAPGGWALRDRNIAWLEAFGSYQTRGEQSNTAESTARSGGILAGVDLPQNDDGLRTGFYVGGFAGNMDIGNFRDIDANGAMAGGYIGKSYDGYYISGQLGVGMSNNDSDRLTGIDTASADYKSYFVSPSLTVMRPIRSTGITWVPSATLRYTAQFDSSYRETGSTANQNVDSHTYHSLDARLMMEARLDGKQISDGWLKPSFRAGVKGQTLLGDNDVDLSVLGNNLTLDPKGSNNYIDGVIGANLSYTMKENIQLYTDAEATLGMNKGGANDNKSITGRAGIRWKW